jgi:DoxX-like family
MPTVHTVIVLAAIAANGFSGVAALLRFKPIIPGMAKAGVPVSWLRFPIGTLKTAGALGLLVGLFGVPWIGTAAAVGLILFFACAIHTHLLARDYSSQFGLAIGFLALNTATLALQLTA